MACRVLSEKVRAKLRRSLLAESIYDKRTITPHDRRHAVRQPLPGPISGPCWAMGPQPGWAHNPDSRHRGRLRLADHVRDHGWPDQRLFNRADLQRQSTLIIRVPIIRRDLAGAASVIAVFAQVGRNGVGELAVSLGIVTPDGFSRVRAEFNDGIAPG